MTEYMRAEEVAEYCRQTLRAVRHWRECNIGPEGQLVGRHVLYRRADVEAWMSNHWNKNKQKI